VSEEKIEEASLVSIEPGRYAVHLPWRRYSGLAVKGEALRAARELTTRLLREIEDSSADYGGLDEFLQTLMSFEDLLKSGSADRLVDIPVSAEGSAFCIRPLQLALTPDGQLGVIVHLDTIASFTSFSSRERAGM